MASTPTIDLSDPTSSAKIIGDEVLNAIEGGQTVREVIFLWPNIAGKGVMPHRSMLLCLGKQTVDLTPRQYEIQRMHKAISLRSINAANVDFCLYMLAESEQNGPRVRIPLEGDEEVARLIGLAHSFSMRYGYQIAWWKIKEFLVDYYSPVEKYATRLESIRKGVFQFLKQTQGEGDKVAHCDLEICTNVTNLTTCGKCGVVHYCSKEHQVRHWPIHKQRCQKSPLY